MGAESGRVRTPRGVCVMGRIRGPSDDARRKSDDGPVVGVDRDTRKKTRVRSWLRARPLVGVRRTPMVREAC